MNNKNAFTLAELVTVIAILAVLSLILLPTFFGFIEGTQITRANANAKSVYSAASAVITDYCAINKTLSRQPMGDLLNSSNISSASIGGENFCFDAYLLNMEGTACIMLNVYGTGIDFVTWMDDPYYSPPFQVSRSDQKSDPYGPTAVLGDKIIGCYPLA